VEVGMQRAGLATGVLPASLAVLAGLAALAVLLTVLHYHRRLAAARAEARGGLQGVTNTGMETEEPLGGDNRLAAARRAVQARDNPLYDYTVNYSRPEKTVNIDKARQEDRKGQEEPEDVYVYQEPCEVRNDLKAALERQGEEEEMEHYDHLNYTRTVNDILPNYVKFSNEK
jgi:hypothetical protein